MPIPSKYNSPQAFSEDKQNLIDKIIGRGKSKIVSEAIGYDSLDAKGVVAQN